MRIDWEDWQEHKKHVQERKKEQKKNIHQLLESDKKEIKMSIKDFIDIHEDDEWKMDMLDIMEEALMKIADGEDDPKSIAINALKKFRGED